MYTDTNNTDFDLFLNDFDSSKPSKSNGKKKVTSSNLMPSRKNDPNKSLVRPSTSSAASSQQQVLISSNGSVNRIKNKPVKPSALDFDSQLLSIDEQLSAKKLGKSKSESKLIAQKSIDNNQVKIKSKETPMKKVNFIYKIY